jgi:hypothetical protein
MKPGLSSLLVLGSLLFAAPLLADSIPCDPIDTLQISPWSGNGSKSFVEDFKGGKDFGAPFPEAKDSFDWGKADPQFGGVFFSGDWATDHFPGTDSFDHHGNGWDGRGWTDWDHDRNRDGRDPGTPSAPIPEPESLWLFLAGVAVVGFCQLLRRAMPLTPNSHENV